jgi:hypothetical protein
VSKLAQSAQIVIVDNTEPPNFIVAEPATVFFTGLQDHGRYGLLPLSADTNDELL